MMFSCRYLSWDDYFIALAFLSAQRSKDPNKQVSMAPALIPTSGCGILACAHRLQ